MLADYYRNKRVIVSGCSSGIGRATAELLSRFGAEVYGLDTQLPKFEIGAFAPADLRDPTTIDAALDRVGGRIDCLFNCAGVGLGHAPLDVLKVNFLGTRYLAERTLEQMGVGGAIASVASNGGLGWRKRLPELLELLEIGYFGSAVRWCQEQLAGSTLQSVGGDAYRFSKEALILWTMRQSSRLIRLGIRIN